MGWLLSSASPSDCKEDLCFLRSINEVSGEQGDSTAVGAVTPTINGEIVLPIYAALDGDSQIELQTSTYFNDEVP